MSESIKSGQHYNITNEENGWKLHGEERQREGCLPTSITCPSYNRDALQWIIERQSDGQWTIRSVKYQKYLGFENAPKDGAPIVGRDKPHLWDIEIQSADSEEDDDTRVKYVCFIAHISSAQS
jgi:hypothetical protein